jgi:uncharacterized protein YjcR
LVGNHKRNTVPMLASPRCGAKTRRGTCCRSPAVGRKKRCRMHGGARGAGAPAGNKNALKHGTYTREAFQQRQDLSKMCREVRKLLREHPSEGD